MESRSQTMTSPRSQSVLDGATREQTNTSLAWSPVPSPLLNSDFTSDVETTSSNESDTEMSPAKELSSSDLQSSNNLFLNILYKILRKPPSKKEQETHEEIKRKLHPKKRIAAECLEEYSQSRGGDFILKEAKNATTSVHDFGVCVSQDWPSVKFLREKEGLMFVLSLTAKDFDGAGDLNFPKAKKSLCTKGGIEYYLPNSDWIRIGLKCRGRYDYGTDNWLEEKNPLEWTVGFHASHQAGTASVCQNREFLTEGPGQVHRNDIDVNELSDLKGEPCGRGAYFANDIDICLRGFLKFKLDGKACVLQVRLNPQKTRIPENKKCYRIINDPRDMRPTAICLKISNSDGCSVM